MMKITPISTVTKMIANVMAIFSLLVTMIFTSFPSCPIGLPSEYLLRSHYSFFILLKDKTNPH
jgi:hypothetical protein